MSSSSPGSMTRWADALRSPDPAVRDEAARQIWERYANRLLVVVRRHLDERVRRREDENDVLQSLYQSFCTSRRRADEPLKSRDDLWRLLVHIALCKVANTAKRHHAGRRDVRREQPMHGGGDAEGGGTLPDWMVEVMDRSEPSPDEALALHEELEGWLSPLPDDLRRIALWKLEGYTNKEIGDRIERTERTVELKLRVIRSRLEERFAAAGVREPGD
ncbi:MAG: ECF-type sigma factor [Isosphaeraceae bacterium]